MAGRGTALLGSVTTKMRGTTAAAPCAPPLSVLHLHSHLLAARRRRSAPTASRRPFSSSDKDSSQNKNNVPGQLHSAKSAPMPTETKVLCLAVFGTSAFFYGWLLPRLEALSDELVALRRERSILIKAVEECQRTHIKAQDDPIDPSNAQNTQALGQGKESGGRAF